MVTTVLLHLDSAANRGADSLSRRLTRDFADAWIAGRGGEYRYRDLALDPVPPIDHAYCAPGRRLQRDGLRPPAQIGGAVRGAAEAAAWAVTRPLIEDLIAARVVLIGAPMYNYSVPAALKAWMDRVTFPGALSLPDTTVVVVAAHGGAPGRAGRDHQTPLLRTWFDRLGVRAQNLHLVVVERTMAPLLTHLAPYRADADESLADARAHLLALAAQCV
jgi:FMN-dependent NADH-azoreductase